MVESTNGLPRTADRGPQVIHDIIMGLYSDVGRADDLGTRTAFVAKNKGRLDMLWRDMPDEMKFDANRPSAPPHIFTLQCVFFSTSISALCKD